MARYPRVFVLAGWLVAVSTGSAGAELTATLERDPIRDNETVQLTVELSEQHDGPGPNLDALNVDFEVLGTSTNTQRLFVGGRQSATTQWVIELAPRRVGDLTIPSITIGTLSTQALTLKVLAFSRTGASDDGIYLETEVDTDRAYVQAQIRLTVRLVRSVEILDGSLTDPQVANATIRRLGRDLSYSVTRNGLPYRVIERRYAIFPHTSGTTVIPSIAFDGEIAEARGAGSGFSRLFTRGRRVKRSSEPLRVTVAAQPEAFLATPWLPAADVELLEKWSIEPPSFTVGEPITRTVTIKSSGLRGDQLPDLDPGDVAGVKVYPDQPATQTTSDAQWVYGVTERSSAYVPTRPGETTIPEVRVAWWDTGRDRPRSAVLPSRTVQVAPAPAGAAVDALRLAGGEAAALEVPASGSAESRGSPRLWQGVSAAMLIGWLLTAGAWWRSRRAETVPLATDRHRGSRKTARSELRRACHDNDPGRARAALVAWGRIEWPTTPPGGIIALADRLGDAGLRLEITALDRALYAPDSRSWKGVPLWRCASSGLRSRAPESKSKGPTLPGLYPTRA